MANFNQQKAAHMQIAVISGSSRENSQSSKIAMHISAVLAEKGHDFFNLCLNKNKLPQWDEDIWTSETNWNPEWRNISNQLKNSDGIIIVTPEWDGMVPHCLKNFFHLCCNGELYHKPALIVAVSSGLGGNYPIAELRMSSYKNTKICYIPEHVVIRHVEKYFNSEQTIDAHEEKLRYRLSYTVDVLLAYSDALNQVKQKNILNRKKYPTGM